MPHTIVPLERAFAQAQLPGAPATFNWQSTNEFVTLTGAQVVSMAIAIAIYIQHTFTALNTVTASIKAGTITTTAQVDAFAWPSNSLTV